MAMLKALVLAGITGLATATELLLPLYTDPGTGGSDWTSVQTALAGNPGLQAKVVINVNNGPGDPFSTGAGANWIAGGQALAKLSNVALLGYVPVGRATRNFTDVQNDVKTWATWITDHNVNISGIFVDEAPNSNATELVAYIQSLTSYIRTTVGLPVIVYNPGFPETVHALDAYYALNPDFISALETCFATTSNGIDLCTPAGSYEVYDKLGYGTTVDNTLAAWVGTENYAKTAVLIHGFHDTNGLYNATSDVLSNELKALVQRDIGASIFTANQWITPDAAPADIGTVVSLLDAANSSPTKREHV